MSTPLISIVVPTLNQAAFIEQTLASITGQTWPRTELIVVDGGSTDGTREIVARFAPAVTHFISEPDRGQADAINKGFRLAAGEILAWLNSDDYYLPLAFQRVAAALDDPAQPRLVHGSVVLLFEDEDRGRIARARPFPRRELDVSSCIYQPGAFWTRSLWEKTGPLNPDYHFVLDWDWWRRAREHTAFTPLDECLAVYRFHRAHKTGSGVARRTEEILALVERHATPEWIAAFRDVAQRLDRLSATWRRFALNGRYRWHKLRHLDLYLRHGDKVDAAFWQLQSSSPPSSSCHSVT
jgi:glycosyltransferase involved in cell wall biosynthesis